MKKLISYIFILIVVFSCSKKENNTSTFARKMQVFDKISKDSLGILSTPTYYYLDTVRVDTIKTQLKIKNVSKNIIKGFTIEPTCGCTIITKKVDEVLLPYKDYNVSLKIDLSDTKGYFTKSIIIYGSFYPFYRNIVIEGYKK